MQFAVEINLDGHARLVLAACAEEVGHGLDAQCRVAGRIPVRGVLAIVQKILDDPRCQLALGVGLREQLEKIGVGFVFAAVPAPPITVGQAEPGRLVLLVLLDVLADVSHDHVEFFLFALFFQGDSVHGHRVNGYFRAVAV